MGRPREHDDQTRDALLRAAEQLLAKGEALSVRAVAEATATTTRAVYSVFGSMDGLTNALLERAFREIRERVDALPVTSDPRADLVRAGLDGFRPFALAHPTLFALSFERLVPGVSHEHVPEATAAIRALHTRVQRCAAAGHLGTRSADAVTWQFHAFCQGLASVELHGWFADDPERQWREALTAFTHGLAAPTSDRLATPPGARVSRVRSGRRASSRGGTKTRRGSS